jgi:hypothetical protein
VRRAATALADAVRITLGPKSKCVLIEKKWGKPNVCNSAIAHFTTATGKSIPFEELTGY